MDHTAYAPIREEVPASAFDAASRRLADALPTVRGAAVLRLGRPDGAPVGFVLRPREEADHALRADVVAALLARCREPVPWVWLARDGELGLEDADAAWHAAARTAFGEARRPLRFVLVTPEGWVERTGGG